MIPGTRAHFEDLAGRAERLLEGFWGGREIAEDGRPVHRAELPEWMQAAADSYRQRLADPLVCAVNERDAQRDHRPAARA